MKLRRFIHYLGNGTLHITQPGVIDKGVYRCLAKNVAGQAEKRYALEPGQKPQIRSTASTMKISFGQTLNMPCNADGWPQAKITWTLPNGLVLDKPQVIGRVTYLSNGTLQVKETSKFDRGTYTCKATNTFGSSTLSYPVMRPRFTQPAKMRKRVIARPVGSSVRLKCTASGNPRPDIVWLKDSRPLTPEEVGEGRKKKWTLSLKNLTPEHSGKYTCHVSNRAGEINATYKVEVIQRTNSKPILTGTHPVNTTVDYGGTTSFQCKVRSDVKPVIQWLKRVEPGGENKYNSTIEVGDHRFVVLPTGDVWSRPDGSYLNKLLITRAKEEDAGMYICLGANTMGYSFRSAFLTVLPDPKPPFSPIPSVLPPSLPWPVIIGIPAGVVFILGTVLLWFCQSRKHCSSGAIISAQTLPNGHRQLPRERALTAADKDCIGSVTYEEYLAQQQQQQLLLAQAAPKVYPKIYSDIHTHTHSHVDGKIHQHQHIHYQC
uniref:Fibroblast growth factor receptor like 1a n=1 Tax=Sinocyclocheilus anshuiensis TaxID=1608454 RepID=A0A671PWU8_9TELE